MKRASLAVLLTLLVSAIAPAATACVSDENFTPGWDDAQDVNARFHDYGRIHMDAEDPLCAEAAMYRLTTKVGSAIWEDYPNRTMRRDGAFQQWLDGYVVAIIYSAALRMGALGWASRELDKFLLTLNGVPGLDTVFMHRLQNEGCDNEDFNTCTDDYTGTAAAYAWMSLYKERRTRGSGAAARTEAINKIGSAFDSVCIWSPHTLYIDRLGNRVTLCDRSVANLEVPGSDAETLSVNTSQQLIAYGFGLMTSIASAHLALKETAHYELTDPQKKIARALFHEARKHVASLPHPGGSLPQLNSFKNDCLSEVSEKRTGPDYEEFHWKSDSHCGGAASYPYDPNHYQLQSYYEKTSLGITFGNLDEYQSGSLEDRHFSHDFGDDGDFSYGRYVTYKYHGWQWWERTDLDFMPYDDNDPIGELVGVTPTGVAYGWACDVDAANLRRKQDVRGIWVDFYRDGHVTEEETLTETLATLPTTDQEVIGKCRGGMAHNFAVQLPPESRGNKILAYGLDYTWYGHLLLPCKNEPCSW
jgi:hypothetical protein